MFFCALFWASICLNASAAWQPVTAGTYSSASDSATTDYLTITYNRKPGIYFHPFTLTITGTTHATVASGSTYYGIWSVPYDKMAKKDNSTRILNFNGDAKNAVRSTTRTITSWDCFTGSGGGVQTINANLKYWYRIYPYDGSVTPGVANGSMLSNGGTVTFTTPQCCWPTYYTGNSTGNNRVSEGTMWPDVLINYSTQSMADVPDPTYQSYNICGTYRSWLQNTSASLDIPADGNIYYVKVRLGVHAGGDDYDYSDKINQYVFYTRPLATASPAAGTYNHTQEVSLTGNENCEMYYTTDGSTPSKANGIKYAAPIRIAKDTTLRVQAYRDGVALGNVSEFRYVIALPGVKASPAGGTVMPGTEVTLSLTASDAAHTDIVYTTDGSLPPDKWKVYTSPVPVASSGKLYAAAKDKVSGRYGEMVVFTYTYAELGYMVDGLSFWQGSTRVEESALLASLAGKTVHAKASVIKAAPQVQGLLVIALYGKDNRLVKLGLSSIDQQAGTGGYLVESKSITLPADLTDYVLKAFVVQDFMKLQPVGGIAEKTDRNK